MIVGGEEPGQVPGFFLLIHRVNDLKTHFL